MKIPNFIAVASASVLLSACMVYPTVGSSQADTPPRILNKDGRKIWDNPSLFGPLPAEKLAQGQQVCSTLDSKDVKHEAKGYHAKAQDIDGKAFANGGYFCVPKN